MPTLDVRGMDVHALDAQNNPIVGNVIRGLKVNYHSNKVPTPQQLFRLHESLELAKVMARRALDITTNAYKQIVLGEIEYEIFCFHFRLPPLDRKIMKAWHPYLARIHRVYSHVVSYLNEAITISDSYSCELNGNNQLALAEGVVFAKNKVMGLDQQTGDTIVRPDAMKKKTIFDPGWGKTGKVKALKLNRSQKGSIHVPFEKLTVKPLLYQARTLIHESTHKVKDTRDVHYAMDMEYKTMTPVEAIDNADSYAWTALCLYKNMLVKNTANGDKLAREGNLDTSR